MLRQPHGIGCLLAVCAISGGLAGCGGDSKKKVEKPTDDTKPVVEAPPAETEADREKKRVAAVHAIVAENSNCLPASFKTDAPTLQLAAVGNSPMLCAIDNKADRLLGVLGCWTVSIADGKLAYSDPKGIPGRGYGVKVENNCARGYCLPNDAKSDERGLLVWNEDGSKVGFLVGDDIHIFDAGSKAHEKSVKIRGDKGVSNNPVGLAWVGGHFFVEGADDGPFAAVWVFKDDGTAMGAIEALGAKEPKALSTHGGSFLVLDKERVAVSEQGLTTLTTYEIATGKRAKITRKLAKTSCKPAEIEAYWLEDKEKTPAKCKDELDKQFAAFAGADALAGKNNHLFAMRGDRIGELAVIEPKALTEKKDKLIKLPWCGEGGDGDGDAAKKDGE